MFDFTSSWVFMQQRPARQAAWILGGALLLFIGWTLGYSSGSAQLDGPVVFYDKSISPQVAGATDINLSSGGTDKELDDLKAVAETLGPSKAKVPTISKAPVTQKTGSASAVPIVSGSTAPSAAVDAAQGQFVASVNSKLYHHISCPSAKQIKPANRRYYATQAAAKASGRTPSKCTIDKVGNN